MMNRIEGIWGSGKFEFLQEEATGRSGGLLTVWDANMFTVYDAVGNDQFVTVRGVWKDVVGEIVLVNVYGRHDNAKKVELWNNLKDLMGSTSMDAWCLCEDFNEIRGWEERLNSQTDERSVDFNDFIARTRLLKVPMGGKKFTRISDDGLKFSKLDRFTKGFKMLCGELAVIALDRKLSNHCPIVIVLKDGDFEFGPNCNRSPILSIPLQYCNPLYPP